MCAVLIILIYCNLFLTSGGNFSSPPSLRKLLPVSRADSFDRIPNPSPFVNTFFKIFSRNPKIPYMPPDSAEPGAQIEKIICANDSFRVILEQDKYTPLFIKI